jgi:hypothetical protein
MKVYSRRAKMTTNEELLIRSEPGIERGHGAFQVERAKRPHDELAIARGARLCVYNSGRHIALSECKHRNGRSQASK